MFRLALEFPSEAREEFLHRFCADDPLLLAQVLALLHADSMPQTGIDKPAVGTQFRIRAAALSYTGTRH